MSNTVDSTSDARVANNAVRHQYRVLTDAEKAQMLAVKDAGAALLAVIEALPASKGRSCAITRVEEAVMWAVKGITA